MGDLGKLIVAKGFEKLPKVQYIAQSGHTAYSKCFKVTGVYGPYCFITWSTGVGRLTPTLTLSPQQVSASECFFPVGKLLVCAVPN